VSRSTAARMEGSDRIMPNAMSAACHTKKSI
jgi:hypothetical protein